MTDRPDNDERTAPHGPDPLRRAREQLHAAEKNLQRARSVRSTEDDALTRLLDVVESVNSELDIESVLDTAARQIIAVFEAERVFVADVGPAGRITFRLATTFKGDPVPLPVHEVSHAVIQEVVRKRTPLLVADATADPRFAQVSSVQHLELHSVMAAPLMARGELMGVVYADNRSLSGAFDASALNRLGIFANHVGIALRNAQLFHRLEEARTELALSERLRTIGELATFLAHEIKNPLGSIQILVDTLRERWSDASVRSHVLEVVPQEVSRLNAAVKEILDYARPSPLIKVPVDLHKIMDSALRSLSGQLGDEGLQVSKSYEPGMPATLADGQRLREVFVNLVLNSLEAMSGQSHKTLSIRVRRCDETRQEVTIQDNGPGLPEGEIDRLFEPFRSHKQSGTGIGLAVCQKVVREHGGAIVAENAEGGGARFRVTLPTKGT